MNVNYKFLEKSTKSITDSERNRGWENVIVNTKPS